MAYHIDLGVGLFAAAGTLATAIAVLTVGQQAWTLAQGRAMSALVTNSLLLQGFSRRPKLSCE